MIKAWLALMEPKAHFLLSQVYNEQLVRLQAISDGVMDVQEGSDVSVYFEGALVF